MTEIEVAGDEPSEEVGREPDAPEADVPEPHVSEDEAPEADVPEADVPEDEAPEDEAPAGGSFPARLGRRGQALYRLGRRPCTVPLILVVAVGVICTLNHFHGVDWGDDFALYMRQAKALNIGNISEVISNNRYTVDNSGWHTFSPVAYPWGWPLLVAPVYAVFGLDYSAIKAVEVASLCVFLLLFYDLVRRRAGAVAATVLLLLIGLSPSYVGYTDTVLSDLPYLCFVGVTLWWLDRCRREGILDAPRRDLVILGLLVAFTFNIRREGLALVAVVAVLELTVVAGRAIESRSWRAIQAVPWRRALLPFETFAAAAIAFQLLLPTQALPPAPGAGLRNVHGNLFYFRDILAEDVGLKGAGAPMQLFHSRYAAKEAVALLVALAMVGIVARLLRHLEEDITLATYLACLTVVILVSPYQEGRYLDTLTPFIVYFAYQALPTLFALEKGAARPDRHQPAATVAILAFAGLVFLNARYTAHSTDYHIHYPQTVNGPDSPASQQMFAAVDQYTRGSDIILFFRARALTLYTDRVALQGTNLDQMLPRIDWYMMEKGSTYSQPPVTDADVAAHGLTIVWQNSDWVLWRVPHATS